jgi:hypothetical protein
VMIVSVKSLKYKKQLRKGNDVDQELNCVVITNIIITT